MTLRALVGEPTGRVAGWRVESQKVRRMVHFTDVVHKKESALRSSMKIVAVASVAAMALAGCGTKSTTTTASSTSANGASSAAGKAFKACMVLDTGGVDDRSFNQSSWAGLQAANKSNPNISISYVASNSQNDYAPNLAAEVNKSCDTIIAVRGLMSDAVKASAKQNAKQQYAQ